MKLITKILGWIKKIEETEKHVSKKVDTKKIKLNVKKDKKDDRDFLYTSTQKVLSTNTDLTKYCSPIRNQGRLGSCTAFAFLSSLEIQKNMLKDPVNFSELFLYYNERLLQGWEKKDGGAFVRDGCKTLKKDGVCLEQYWPYITNKVFDKPKNISYLIARFFRIKNYQRCYSIESIKEALAENNPVIFGMKIYNNFFNYKKGVYKTISGNQRGGHAMCIVGYDDQKMAFRVRNSWGTYWGEKGYCWINYNTFKQLWMDAWIIKYK